MINPELHLNEKMFDQDVEKKATRIGFGTGLLEIGEKNSNVVALSADLTESTQNHLFANKFPERFFEMGVAEQNMAAVAAGLGVTGKIPFISSYATFSPGKNWETIRTTIVYNHSNVKVAAHHAGVMTGPDGATHQATEDIASVRAWPGFVVMNPCDAEEARKMTVYAGETDGPMYLRFTRDKTPLMTTNQTPFTAGKIQKFWISNNPEVTIIGSGYILYEAMLAARELEQENIHVIVANLSTIKPLDIETLVALASETGAIITVEDHQIMGGVGGAVAEAIVQHHPIPMEFIGLRDTFAESGKPEELLAKYHMNKEAIKEAVKKILVRKKA